MARIQNFLKLDIKDFTGDERLRMCSPAAWGIYSYLLCLLNTQPVRGAYQLSILERRPNLKRSLTQRVLCATSDSAKVAPFADILQRQMPWKKSEILRALKELLFYKVIVIEDDALIQPRMYRDGGNELKKYTQNKQENDEENNGDFLEEKTEENSEKKTDNSSYTRTRTPLSIENNNILNNQEKEKKKEKKGAARFQPPTLEEVREYFQRKGTFINPDTFFAHYEANGWVQSRGKPVKNWKACLVTWEQREKEFNTQRKTARTAAVPHTQNFDDMETW